MVHMADLPLDVDVQFMTVMETTMPFVGVCQDVTTPVSRTLQGGRQRR